jgi:hypothetical protein
LIQNREDFILPEGDKLQNYCCQKLQLKFFGQQWYCQISNGKKMKKILLVLAVVIANGIFTSCTDQHADESEFTTLVSGIDGEIDPDPKDLNP